VEGIELNEKYVYLYNCLGIALRKQGKFQDAIQNYNRALKIDPQDANLYYNLCKAFAGDKDYDKAKDSLKKAVKLDPGLKDLFDDDPDFDTFRERLVSQ